MEKRLYKSVVNRKISGVCGGIAEYFNIDPTLVRILWAVVSLCTAIITGIIVYFICALIMDDAPTY